KPGDLPWLTDLDYLLGELVQPVPRTVPADQVVVAKPVQIAGMDIRRMDDDIHVFLDRHRLIVTHQWALDQVVALAMAVKPRFGWPPVFAHEVVKGVPYVLAGGAGLQEVERELARGLAELEFILHGLRYLGADDAGATKLRVHPAGPVVFHEQCNLIPLLDDTVLQVAIGEFRRLAERHRRAEINAVLAAVALAVVLRYGGDFSIAHARLRRREGGAHRAVLHQCGALHQFHFLGAFYDLDPVDHVRRIDEARLRKRALDVVEQRVRHLIGPDIANGRLGEWLECARGELGVVLFSVVGRGIARRRENAFDATPVLIAL